MDPITLTTALKDEARRLGFDLVGACRAEIPPGLDCFRQWLAAGYAAEMHYLPGRAEAYEDPQQVLPGVRSILMLAVNYHASPPAPLGPGQGRVSRYAWAAADYHDVLHQRLRRLARRLTDLEPQAKSRAVVDTAPLLERDFARLAGLGWIGKNTMLLNERLGSWLFLGALLTDQQLQYDEPHTTDRCGTCRACLDACPTKAFPRPYVLDAARCISYLTIELRGQAPADLRTGVGDWLFGCDLCQEACPWNRRSPQSPDPTFQPLAELNPVRLCELFTLGDDAFRRRFRRTPLWRPKRGGLLRNAAIVLGNQRPPWALDTLAEALADSDCLVRAACAWALGRYQEPRAAEKLRQRLAVEADPAVRHEIEAALDTPAAS